MTAEVGGDEDLDAAFRGLDTTPGGTDDLRRTILNQRDRLVGAEAEVAAARREAERLKQENAQLRVMLHRAQRWPFGWFRSLVRRARAVSNRLARMAP